MSVPGDDICLSGEALSPQLIAQFQERGYLHIRGFFSELQVEELIQAIQEVEQGWLAESRTHVNGVPLKFGQDLDGAPIVQRFAFASQFHPRLHALLQEPRLKSLLPLLGPDARLAEDEKDGMVINHYLNHGQSKFARMGWHTDAIRGLFYDGKPEPMLNLGIHLDDFPASFGGLRVLPGTHRQNLLKFLLRKPYFLDHKQEKEEVGFDIKAGDLTVHDGRIWHRVAQCTKTGAISRRRVIYVPILTGAYRPKHAQSKTPFYHKFLHWVK